ncbi:hypothetical protein [Celeribacter naphthalenivorans]|uniref:hypothetical protein n=1 Tax=Celeribacter naphthalenivorans TaxID=1614694 RepID=UPI001CFC19FB|nr:hypothetical protein [Celeribacter naphthalenivorans]
MKNLLTKIDDLMSRPAVQVSVAVVFSFILGAVVLYSVYDAVNEIKHGSTWMGDPYDASMFPLLLVMKLLGSLVKFVLWGVVIVGAALVPTIPFFVLYDLRKGLK